MTEAEKVLSRARAKGHADKGLESFDKLTGRAYLFTSPGAQSLKISNSSATDPDVIILCTWMGALPRHIAKYTDQYLKRFANIPILLIRSGIVDVFMETYSSPRKQVMPAAVVLKAMEDSAGASGRKLRVLLHVMSNGGGSSAVTLAQMYQLIPTASKSDAPKLPVTAMVVDSAPSLPDGRRAYNAMMQAVPKFFLLRSIAGIFFWFSIILSKTLDSFGRQNFVLKMRTALNNTRGPFLNKDTPRTYICGKGDAMVLMDDVVLHASEARQELEKSGGGYVDGTIVLEEFKGSKHVTHMTTDVERYWKLVHETWARVAK